MSHAASLSAPVSSAAPHSLTAALRDRLVKYIEYRRTVNALDALGPRALADIGLERSTIESTARYHTYGK